MICGFAAPVVQPSFSADTPTATLHNSDQSNSHSCPLSPAPSSIRRSPRVTHVAVQPDMSSHSHRVLLKNIGLLWTGESDTLLQDYSIYVENGIIQWVGKHQHLPASLEGADHVVEDMTNRVVVPGLINAHHHMYQSLTKCMARESQLFEWLQTLFPIWTHLTPDMVYKSAKFAIAELLLSGCTLTSDMLYLYPNGVTLDDTIRAAKELGIRFMPCRGAISVGESSGGLPPDALVENEEDILSDMRRLIEEYHDSRDGAMIRIALAPCSPFSVSEQLMAKSAQLAREYKHVMLHTHFAENNSDMEYMKITVRKSLTKFLDDCGWNRSDCWFAHCVKLGEDENCDAIQYFADNGLGVAHCPVSNCRLASGIAPVREMMQKGVNVGLGVDGSASNDSGNLLSEARMALMLARVKHEKADAMSTTDVLRMATSGGAAVLGRTDVGIIRPGMCADVAGWRVDQTSFAGTFHSKFAMLSSLVLGNGGDLRADFVMVNGRVLVRGGELSGNQDMAEIIAEHNVAALALATAARKGVRADEERRP